jgi:CHAD domain-containing protein
VASTSAKLARKSTVKGARKLLLQHLEQAVAASERLPDPEDADALHDLRVALRHLRTYLTTYRKLLADAVPARSLDTLRELTHLTNPARDAEVLVSWIAGHSRARRGPASPTNRLRSRLTERHDQLLREIRDRFADDFPQLARRLQRQLERAENGGSRTFGQYTAKQVRRQGRRFRKRLERIEGIADIDGCHQARIAAKRVRYLLEPFDELRGVSKLIDRLKELQDTLGELHDLHVLLETMSDAPESAHGPKKRGRSELASLASTARRRMTRLYAEVEKHWLDGAGAELDKDLSKAASSIREAGHA